MWSGPRDVRPFKSTGRAYRRGLLSSWFSGWHRNSGTGSFAREPAIRRRVYTRVYERLQESESVHESLKAFERVCQCLRPLRESVSVCKSLKAFERVCQCLRPLRESVSVCKRLLAFTCVYECCKRLLLWFGAIIAYEGRPHGAHLPNRSSSPRIWRDRMRMPCCHPNAQGLTTSPSSKRYIWRPLPPWAESMTILVPSGLERGWRSQRNVSVYGGGAWNRPRSTRRSVGTW